MRIIEQYDIEDYAMIYAYGDTAEDHAMLELAHEKYYNGRKVEEVG